MIDEEFLFAIAYNNRIADGALIYITPRSFWTKNNAIAESYTDSQYSVLYSMTQEVYLDELMEGVYQSSDASMTIDELELNLEQAGFVKDDEFVIFVEETEIF